MTKKTPTRPPEGTPEFKKWLKEQTAKDINDIFGDNYQAVDFSEVGVLSGSKDLLEKSDAELFPDEIEEYTPEERRKEFKVYTKSKNKKD